MFSSSCSIYEKRASFAAKSRRSSRLTALLLARYECVPNPTEFVRHEDVRTIDKAYDRIRYMRHTPRVRRALSANWDAVEAENKYMRLPRGLVVIEDFLTSEALEGIE